ncbi:hypothetical protein KJB62_12595 [Staphylococcus saprophyticus]|uniref:hypothetical protein n=1 Tax=Staphylococcus saprophyticus TaxID=29385 RepID=UPI001F1D7374|nr:hypothetical protein [Staphylococcus saprophyticus]MCE5132206.1 hypothetical protein [Staphylococcus saprophyticus]
MKQLSITKYVPKKHQNKIEDFYKDIDGCWLLLKEDYISAATECSTIHEDTINEVRKQLKTIINLDDFEKMDRNELNNIINS